MAKHNNEKGSRRRNQSADAKSLETCPVDLGQDHGSDKNKNKSKLKKKASDGLSIEIETKRLKHATKRGSSVPPSSRALRSVASYFNPKSTPSIPQQENESEPENLSPSQEGGEGGRDATNAYQRNDPLSDPSTEGLPGHSGSQGASSADGTGNGSESPVPSSNAPRKDDPPLDLLNGGPPGQPPVGENQAEGNQRPSHSNPADPAGDPEAIYLRESNLRLINELKKSETFINKLKKESTNQKSHIKKLTDKCDTLQRKLSKLSGMRKFTEKNDSSKISNPDTEKLKSERDLAQIKYASLKEEITVATRNLYSVLEDEPAPDVIPPKTQAKQKKPTKNNRPKFRPATVDINVSKSGKSGINMKSTPPSTTNYSMTPDTNTVLWGTSLVEGMGNELRDRGIDATAICFPGGRTNYMKDRAYASFANLKTKPKNIVVQTAGNCCDDIKMPTESIINNYETIIQEIKRAAPASRIVCSSIPPRRDNPWVNLRIKKVNDYLKTRGELNIDNVSFVDVAPKDLKTMFRQDKVHFNYKGKAEYARGLKHEILNFPQLVQNSNV